MSRPITLLLASIALITASLAAIAAVGGESTPVISVTPQVHRSGEEGYFLLQVPLPKGVSAVPFALTARVDQGDIFLTNAYAPLPRNKEKGTAQQIAVTGRFGHAGPARMTILTRSANAAFKPLMTLNFQLPEGDTANPEARTTWAQQQQWALQSADQDADDSYTLYWNLAIAPRYGLEPGFFGSRSRANRDVPDLYSVFTGAAAIQESLQLEALGDAPRSWAQREAVAKAGQTQDESVALDSLTGPNVKSHPFREMLKGRTPRLPVLSAFIPQDQYAVFFSDITKQIELADLMDEWGGNLLHQVETSARDFRVREKISRQLCLENSLLTRWFGDRVVADMAFTGSDPFLKEGTAFTVLFTLKDGERFRKQIEKRYADAVSTRGAARSEFSVNGMRGMAVVSPDRGVSSYTLIMGNTAVVSTSRAALERIVAVAEKRVASLAQADDFRYMRTIFPQDAKEEDIFIYLSDAHIRNLVGPRWKIGEARRMRCAGNMALLANARLWFKAEHRREPTMEELASGGYLGKNPPVCPDHGAYAIDKDGHPHCSLHNRPGLLTPVGDVPLERITPEEAAQYQAFRENYDRYWTQFFDPIGIRVKMGKDIRVQTCILPLIENSWYDGLVALSGHAPGEVTESAVLPRTVFSLRGHIAQEWLRDTSLMRNLTEDNRLSLDWLGNEIALNLCDGQVLFSAGGRAMGLLGRQVGRSSSLEPLVIGYLASALNLPTYLTVKVTDPRKAEAAIPELFSSLWSKHSRNDDEFNVETYTIEDHRGKPVYVANFTLWVIKLRLYSAVVDDRLVIASRRDVVTDLLDASAKGAAKRAAAHEGNMELSVYRSAFKQLEEAVNQSWQEDLRHACDRNLPLAAIMLKNLGVPADRLGSTVSGLRGYEPSCPSGGRYVMDGTTGKVTCTVHGNRFHPRQPASGDQSSKTLRLVNSLERVNARLSFTPEGLMTTVDIKRSNNGR